jgi:ribosome-binding factor A
MPHYRKEKLEKEIRRILSNIILYEMKDPRIGFASIVKVELSRDLKFADVYVSVYGDKKEKSLTMRALSHAKVFLRTSLAKRLQIRSVPVLRFHSDTSIEKSIKVSQILDELSQQKGYTSKEEE